MLAIEIICQVLAFLVGFFIIQKIPILGVVFIILITFVFVFKAQVLKVLKDLLRSHRSQATESEFERMAIESPKELVLWINKGNLRPSQLTFAAEALANASDPFLVVPCLLRLLDHSSSLVREGAVYGLEGLKISSESATPRTRISSRKVGL